MEDEEEDQNNHLTELENMRLMSLKERRPLCRNSLELIRI